MARTVWRDAVAACLIALIAGSLTVVPSRLNLRGLSIDALTGLRWHLLGHTSNSSASPTVVVALDEEAFRTEPFANSPNITWTVEIGRILSAVIDGGATVVGFDVIYPISIEQSAIPFGDTTVGANLRGFDRDFLRALALAAHDGKVVLGEVQLGAHPIVPAPGQRFAVGQQRNIRAINAYTDSDNVVRRLPLSLTVDGEPVPSMALELAARALQVEPQFHRDGIISLAGYRIPSTVPNTVTLNFDRGSEAIPTYSIADLRACVDKGDKDFFRRHFAGKIVMLGALLDAEDQKVTSRRFATAPEGTQGERCAIAAPPQSGKFARNTMSGVYLHATAINNLIERNALTELNRGGAAAAAIGFSALVAGVVLLLAPVGAAIAYLAIALAWTTAAMAAFGHALVVPLFGPFIAGLCTAAAMIGYRFVVSDKDKRFLRRSFALYLAPAEIERMIASNKLPQLGGETRNVTIYFSDIVGFASFSESLPPIEVVALLNEYLSAMADIIEQHSGFIDKYIGDAIVAIFGAPLADPDHARNAVRAALRCRARLQELNRNAGGLASHQLQQRIGLNSGEALVGNIGSRRRFNYTVVGDVVNLASRLEGANKFFGTAIVASQTTVALTESDFTWREIDTVRVKGRAGTVGVFEPLSEAGRESAEQIERAAAYADGLTRWRAADFPAAARSFAHFAADDLPAAKFLVRAQKFAESPPGPNWNPVNQLDEK
jgi:class 3 adenylate cyclase